jgi:hypothetical protein
MALACEALGELSIPALAAADRVWKEAVIDDADPHGREKPVRSAGGLIASAREGPPPREVCGKYLTFRFPPTAIGAGFEVVK